MSGPSEPEAVRRFSAEYLRTTREGMWSDSRAALDGLDLASRERVLDVGCGSGELTRVLAEETPGAVYGVDADLALLAHAADAADADVVGGDATALPLADDAVDLAVCQALLINLPEPAAALEELERVASDAVAAVEPDNAAVTVTSTVDAEAELAERARRAYRDGVGTDVSLGGEPTAALFEDAGLVDVTTTRYDHERTVAPPYSEAELADVRRKASGAGLDDDRATMLAGDLSVEDYDDLRSAWRAMGREAIAQVQDGEYSRREVVPFYVTVGRFPEAERD